MSDFTKRIVEVYELPLVNGIRILRPEQVVLKFGAAGTIDVGALCYLRRDTNKRQLANDTQLVDLTSFNHIRANKVHQLIEFISEQSVHCGKREITLHGMFQTFVSQFMFWADSSSHFEVLNNAMSARIAFREYVHHLKEKTLQNVISINWAARRQEKVLVILEDFLNINGLGQGINLIRRLNQTTEVTNPPCENAQSKVLALCGVLFRDFSHLVIDNALYPFRLNIPNYLGWATDCLWIFPLIKWCMPPHELANRHNLDRSYWAYDFANGKLETLDNIEHRYHNQCLAKTALNGAQLRIYKANSDSRDSARRQAAMQANLAFVTLFIANTGMNKAQVFDLTWNDNYEIGVERQGFRTIKWRAAGRECHFEISVSFMQNFKRYLQLREYLLNGTQFDFLFATLGARTIAKPKKMISADLDNFNRTLRIIDPGLPKVAARQWRAAKGDWLIRNTDPATTAEVLQNSEKTILKHYAEGSETIHLNEMSNFLNCVAETVINKGQPVELGTERAVGICSSFGAPHQLKYDVSVRPDCRNPEGCLFCDKFKVHADERDTRKLLSCRYCLKQTSHLASSEEQFQELFVPIIDRIKSLLDEISRRDEQMVSRIMHEVDVEGELDHYWAGKLEMLTALELII